jgi:hypothetical protein
MTGWTFSTSEQEKPSLQYCYYYQQTPTDGTTGSISTDIATNRVPLKQTTNRNFDVQSALQNCVWFEN